MGVRGGLKVLKMVIRGTFEFQSFNLTMINRENNDLYAIQLSEKLIKRTNSLKINFAPFKHFYSIFGRTWFYFEIKQIKFISLLYKIHV